MDDAYFNHEQRSIWKASKLGNFQAEHQSSHFHATHATFNRVSPIDTDLHHLRYLNETRRTRLSWELIISFCGCQSQFLVGMLLGILVGAIILAILLTLFLTSAATVATASTVSTSTSTTKSTTTSTTSSTTTATTSSTTTATTSSTTTATTSSTTTSTTSSTTTSTTSSTTTTTTSSTTTSTTSSTKTTTTSSTTTSSTSTTTTSTTSTTTTTTPVCSTTGLGSIESRNADLPTSWTFYLFNYTVTSQSSFIQFAITTQLSRDYYIDEVSVVDSSIPSLELLSNPSFESSIFLVDWDVFCDSTCDKGNGLGVVNGSVCYNGTGNCFKVNCRTTMNGVSLLRQSFAITVGHTYTISYWLAAIGGSTNSNNQFYVDIL